MTDEQGAGGAALKPLPCPFCGGEASADDAYDLWIVSCEACQIHFSGRRRESAIAAWNRRAGDAAIEPLDLDDLERRISKYDCEEWSADEGRAMIARLRSLTAQAEAMGAMLTAHGLWPKEPAPAASAEPTFRESVEPLLERSRERLATAQTGPLYEKIEPTDKMRLNGFQVQLNQHRQEVAALAERVKALESLVAFTTERFEKAHAKHEDAADMLAERVAKLEAWREDITSLLGCGRMAAIDRRAEKHEARLEALEAERKPDPTDLAARLDSFETRILRALDRLPTSTRPVPPGL